MFLVWMKHISVGWDTKNVFSVYLKFKFNWVSCILSGNAVLGKLFYLDGRFFLCYHCGFFCCCCLFLFLFLDSFLHYLNTLFKRLSANPQLIINDIISITIALNYVETGLELLTNCKDKRLPRKLGSNYDQERKGRKCQT